MLRRQRIHGKHFFKAYNLAKYVKMTDLPNLNHQAEARWAAAKADAAPHELESAAGVVAHKVFLQRLHFQHSGLRGDCCQLHQQKPSGKRSQG